MINEHLKNFILNCKIHQILTLHDKDIIENLSKDQDFINFIVWLTSVDPYNNEIADKFYEANAITSLPHLKILKTSLNLNSDKFFLEISNLIKPFDEKISIGWRDLSEKLSENKLGKTKLINNLLKSSNFLFYKNLIEQYEKNNPYALYPTSSYRNSTGHVVSTDDYQEIEATMNLHTFTSIKVVEDSLDTKNHLLKDNYKSFGRCVCLIDQNIEDNYGKKLDKYFKFHKIKLDKLVYRAMEVDKHIGNVEKICEDFRKLGVNRNEPILIIGGGVIGDIGAFAASIYHRNTPYIMLATSVVSAIDSGPSPRSCCDAGGFKNLLGSFHAPVLNISDRSFFKTFRTSCVIHVIEEINKIYFVY